MRLSSGENDTLSSNWDCGSKTGTDFTNLASMATERQSAAANNEETRSSGFGSLLNWWKEMSSRIKQFRKDKFEMNWSRSGGRREFAKRKTEVEGWSTKKLETGSKWPENEQWMTEQRKAQWRPVKLSKMFSRRKQMILRRRTSRWPLSMCIESHSRRVSLRVSIPGKKNEIRGWGGREKNFHCKCKKSMFGSWNFLSHGHGNKISLREFPISQI